MNPELLSLEKLKEKVEEWCGIKLDRHKIIRWRNAGLPFYAISSKSIRYSFEETKEFVLSHKIKPSKFHKRPINKANSK